MFACGTVRAGATELEQVRTLKGSLPVERLAHRLRSDG